MCGPMPRVVSQTDVSLPDAKVRCGFPGVKSSEHLSIHGRRQVMKFAALLFIFTLAALATTVPADSANACARPCGNYCCG